MKISTEEHVLYGELVVGVKKRVHLKRDQLAKDKSLSKKSLLINMFPF